MTEVDQEQFLHDTPLLFGKKSIVLRGLKKLVTELTSVKTLFLAFLCAATWYGKISELAGVIGGLATLGVKEIPTEVFTALIQKFTGGGGAK